MRPKPELINYANSTLGHSAFQREQLVWCAEAMQEAAGRIERAVLRLEQALTKPHAQWRNDDPERCYAFYAGVYRCSKPNGHVGPHHHTRPQDARSIDW